ncbi:ABC-type Fe3+-siderophore transport system, permease component [Sterolibacterium denitrificans]|uniref:ABC-type Fe3+-siderophore transport system, permease component n=1 Tax=Sterolibacterium denitrificans TaxID=157592 RepID=A0A7Z7HNJ4_9PROT|nr:iron ABC transporter permease [Sterolibacterium denitrificans]SMB21068.1 ABC-type Fe3+-siderophore transport system, permease component [Sterolibacterium denitrificans]
MSSRRRAILVLVLLTLLGLGSLALALGAGTLSIPPGEILAALAGQDTASRAIIMDLRLPRALAGFACGGLLALAGALMQVLLRNPLADPYVLGISGGAGVGALLAMLLGLAGWLLSGFAFAGALAAMLLVFGLARGDGSWTQTRLLLTGVVVAAGCGAIIALILSIAPEQQLHGMLFWLMGDLSQVIASTPVLLLLALALAVVLPFARELNLLTRGADQAHALGVAVTRLRRIIYVVASLATAGAVTVAGSIGFVGLIVPHLVRLSIGNAMGSDHRLLLPATVLAGGSLLVLADTLARTVIAPTQLPVGVLTALIGVPVFLFLLGRGRP